MEGNWAGLTSMNMSKTLCFKEFTVCGRRSSSPLMGGGGTCGYRILEASHGAEAIQTCEQSQDPIHLLVTDVVMPGSKEGIENPKDEPEYYNATEFEEAGYKFRGRESDTDFLFIDGDHALNCTEGDGIMKR